MGKGKHKNKRKKNKNKGGNNLGYFGDSQPSYLSNYNRKKKASTGNVRQLALDISKDKVASMYETDEEAFANLNVKKQKPKLKDLAKPYTIGYYLSMQIMMKFGTQERFSEVSEVPYSEIIHLSSNHKIEPSNLLKILTHLEMTEQELFTKSAELCEEFKKRISVFKSASSVTDEKIYQLVNLR